jgi:nucleotide-binding universal stress UspA family protein
MYQKILLATDGSEQAEKAGEYAISTADFTGADIIVLYVIDTYLWGGLHMHSTDRSYLDALPQHDLREKLDKQLREEGEKAVESFKDKLEETQCAGKCTNVNLITMIKEGKPSDVILKTIEEEGIDQVIMGKSGKHGLDKFVLGSTADKVVREAEVPVNVIS